MKDAFGGCYLGKTVLITGHTGFKGSWLALWLQELGANVIGYSLPANTTPNNFTISDVASGLIDIHGDIRDYNAFKSTIDQYQPQIIFHLAAQPLVIQSYSSPKETFDVNVSGTVNILEAVRQSACIKAVIMVTSDKCYANQEWLWGYRENDALGGVDPYSASKSMAEMAIAAYRASFGHLPHFPAIASVRAGNVIGGGDFSALRIVPDCMRALMNHQPVRLRNPHSVRPWLHVLDPLCGYLNLAAHLLVDKVAYAEAWNFGPLEQQAVNVQTLVEAAIEMWGEGDWLDENHTPSRQEMGLLRLNWDKAANRLNWRPAYNWQEALQQTVDWFKCYQHSQANSTTHMRPVALNQLYLYAARANQLQLPWITPSQSKMHSLSNATPCNHH